MDRQDKLNAADASGLIVGLLAGLGENTEAEGQYKFRILEAVPERKAEYDALFDKQQRLLKEAKQFADFPFLYKELNDQADAIQDQLDGIEMYVKSEGDWNNNTVMTLGKNDMLDKYIQGSAFTQVGPFMGLISSVSFTAISAADTAASHAGWTEAGSTNAPTFAARIAPSWSAAAAGSKAASAAVSFTMTGAGTLKGAFLILGTGAVTTLMNTSGILFSAGLFSGGDQVVSSGNVVQVSYSLGL